MSTLRQHINKLPEYQGPRRYQSPSWATRYMADARQLRDKGYPLNVIAKVIAEHEELTGQQETKLYAAIRQWKSRGRI